MGRNAAEAGLRAGGRIAAVAVGPVAVVAHVAADRPAEPGGTAHSAASGAAVRWVVPDGAADSVVSARSRAGSGAWERWEGSGGGADSVASVAGRSVRAHREFGRGGPVAWHRSVADAGRRAGRDEHRWAIAGSGPRHSARHHWIPTAASTDPGRYGAARVPTARRESVAEVARRPDRARRGRRTRSPDLRSTARHPVGTASCCAIVAHCARCCAGHPHPVGTVSCCAIVAHCARCFAGHPHPVGTASCCAIVAHCASSLSCTRLRARRYLLSLRRLPGSSPLSAGSGCPRKRRHRRRPASRNSSAPAHAVIIANA